MFHGVDHLERGRLDRQDHVGIGDQILAIHDERDILECRVSQLDGVTGTRLHVQLGTQFDELGDNRGHQSHAPFMRLGFLQNGDVDIHRALQSLAGLGERWSGGRACTEGRVVDKEIP